MLSNRVVNVLIASVGGQGGLTLSRTLAIASVLSNYSVRTGETLGMAQRFGSVLSFVRVGVEGEVYSPLFGLGEADYLICLELIECVRALKYLSCEGGYAVVSNEVKPPISASLSGSKPTPEDELVSKIEGCVGSNLAVVPARDIALKSGSVRASNMVLLGVFNYVSKLFKDEMVEEALKNLFKGNALETSLKAYYEGKTWASVNLKTF